ncbi:hypothetical protein IWW37_003729 [Coemansia sp. RSA 2050]|nr:hypothetical protein IWW37_003729 [Coemansia sp. RSA 2050]KAJ2733489.1 hypothetical protein IW152_003040 [Coemansia sp. BCRC 34962]
MGEVSSLQGLPLHVVQLIVNHVVSSSRLVFAGMRTDSKEYKQLLRPLLWVCSSFRSIARPLYDSQLYLDLTSTPTCDQKTWKSLPRNIGIGYPTHDLAKELIMEMLEASIFGGQALERLALGSHQEFPLVRKVKLCIVMENEGEVTETDEGEVTDTDEGELAEIDEGEVAKTDKVVELDPLVVKANICAFVRRVKEMAPMLREISIEVDNNYELAEITTPHFGFLVMQLSQLASRFEYSDYGDSFVLTKFPIEGVCNLVSIKCHFEVDDNQFTILARQNAMTLEYLSLESIPDAIISSLVQSSEGHSVAYPHLQSLKLCVFSNTGRLLLPAFPGAALFPRLVTLILPKFYPFGDDLLFRGNSATLKHLEMRLSHDFVTLLRRCKIFTATSHPMLRFVKISCYDGLVPDTFATADEGMLFSLGVGSNAPVREIHGAALIDNPAGALEMIGNHANIQVLKLARICLRLQDVISLVGSLPLLSDLHTQKPSFDWVLGGFTHDDQPEYVRRTYGQVGRRFRCWFIDYYGFGDHWDVVMCVLLLALVCPDFDCAATPLREHKGFMKQMEDTIASDAFKQYAPRLQRLLF